MQIAPLLARSLLAAAPAFAQEKLTVFWGIKVELSQYPIQDMIPKTTPSCGWRCAPRSMRCTSG